MNFLRFLLLSALLYTALVGVVHAEQGCPDGFMPNPVWTQGQQACIQSRSGSGYAPPQPVEPRWSKRWGAIASDSNSGKTGIVGSLTSERKAKKEAIARCQAKGGANCQVELTYYNQCGVMAWGEGFMATASADTMGEASTLAVDNCNKGGGNCKVVFSDCSYGERIQ